MKSEFWRSGLWMVLALAFALGALAQDPCNPTRALSDADEVPPDEATPDDEAGTAPSVIDSDPIDGETRVSVLIEPWVEFDRELALTALDPDLMVLRDDNGNNVDGVLNHRRNQNVLQFVPARPLEHGRRYVLEVGEVSDRNGRRSEPITLSFATFINPPRYTYRYVGGALSGYREYLVNELGQLREAVDVVGPGADGQWRTADDAISERAVFEYRADTPVLALYFLGAGGDGRWRTEDDSIAFYILQELVAERVVRRWRYGAPGSDGKWMTSDDVPTWLSTVTYRPDGTLDTIQMHTSAGGDGNWLTLDDGISYEQVHTYNSAGQLVEVRTCVGPGADGRWGNADDLVVRSIRHTFGARGQLVRTTQYEHPGGDGEWGTQDDPVLGIIEYTYGVAGAVERQVAYNGPGADGRWGTDDDAILSYIATERDARGLVLGRAIYTHPGQDGIWLSADDVIAARDATGFDSVGNRQLRMTAVAPGLDGVWLTSDDLLADQTQFDTTW